MGRRVAIRGGGAEPVGVEDVFPALALGASWREGARRVPGKPGAQAMGRRVAIRGGGAEPVGVEGVFPALALGAS